jgi:hypothetical protein
MFPEVSRVCKSVQVNMCMHAQECMTYRCVNDVKSLWEDAQDALNVFDFKASLSRSERSEYVCTRGVNKKLLNEDELFGEAFYCGFEFAKQVFASRRSEFPRYRQKRCSLCTCAQTNAHKTHLNVSAITLSSASKNVRNV